MWNEVVKCGLPEHKRPSEPENETNVEECISRLAANDPTLTKVNLNNMKRTPIPQIQRLIVSLVDNTYLKQLSLANTGLSDNGAEPLVQVIRYNRGLQSINLETNFLSGDFFARFFHYALENETLEEVKAVNQSATFSTSQERAIIDAIFENKNLVKVSVQMRLPESRFYIEKAMLRNADNKRKQRRALAQQNNPPVILDPRLQGLNLEITPSKDAISTQKLIGSNGMLKVETNSDSINMQLGASQQLNNKNTNLRPSWRSPQTSPTSASTTPFIGEATYTPKANAKITNGKYHAQNEHAQPCSANSQGNEFIMGNSIHPGIARANGQVGSGWVIKQEPINGNIVDAGPHQNIEPERSPCDRSPEQQFKSQSTFVLRKSTLSSSPSKYENEIASNQEKMCQNNEILQAKLKLNRVESRKPEQEVELNQQANSNGIPRPPPEAFLIPVSYTDRPYSQEPTTPRPKITAAMLQESPIFNALRQMDMTHAPTKEFIKFPTLPLNQSDPKNDNPRSHSVKVLPQASPVKKDIGLQDTVINQTSMTSETQKPTNLILKPNGIVIERNQSTQGEREEKKERTPPPTVLPKPVKNPVSTHKENNHQYEYDMTNQKQSQINKLSGAPGFTSKIIAINQRDNPENQSQSSEEENGQPTEDHQASWIKQAPLTGQAFKAGPPWARGGQISKGVIKIDS